ncbi:MAG: hypothetical protein ACM3QZ_12540 [Solirubrobacterales bacterium]
MMTFRIWYQYHLDGIPKWMVVKAEDLSKAKRAAKKILHTRGVANVKLVNIEQV